MEPIIGGDVAPPFTAVRQAFRENFISGGEVGAALCVMRQGEVLVDLHGGWADQNRTRPWTGDTLANFYSAGKAIVATLALRLVDRGAVSLDAPLADYWPEFAQGDKGEVTVRQALSHQGTVPAIRRPLSDGDLFDWPTMVDALAATSPWWPVGTRHCYHTNTYGHLVGELVRRAGGEMPAMALRRLADEVGADVWIGVPEAQHDRCAEIIWAPQRPIPPVDAAGLTAAGVDGDTLLNALAHFNPPGYSSVGLVNTSAWRSAQVPSTNGHGSARGLAAFYHALLQPDRVLSSELLSEAARPQSTGPCPILGEDVSFGLGFTPTTDRRPLGPNPRSFGHFGTGGALGFADPDTGVAFGYVMNHVVPRWQSSRNRALVESVYQALGRN